MEFIVETSGRLDATIAAQDSSLSRSRVQKMIKEGSVTINNTAADKSSYSVSVGDVISITLQTTNYKLPTTQPIDQNLTVLYEDDACLVILKPAGIAVHPGHSSDKDEKTILNGVAFLFEERRTGSAPLRFTPDAVLVHRLDKDTTGCLLIAKTPEAHEALQKQFENRTVQKKYVAIVAGVPKQSEAIIDAPLGRSILQRTKMAILGTSSSRAAQTKYIVLDSIGDAALVACYPKTGRTHQIRVHLRSIGNPILGDDAYGDPLSAKIARRYNIAKICLHARELTFNSPADGKDHSVQAPLPDNFESALRETGLRERA